MKNHKLNENLIISGLGVSSAIGQGKHSFANALLNAESKFSVMRRPGRQSAISLGDDAGGIGKPFLGAEIDELVLPSHISQSYLRTASFSAKAALAILNEAWVDAKLDEIDSERIGLVVGGSNFQQRELTQTHESFQNRVQFVRPNYAISFMDSDICGLCTEIFGIKGFAYTVGGASASGQLAVLQAIQAVTSGQVDVCIALGALMDISYWECHGFRALGAMGSDRFADAPQLACRPFDEDHDGFIYGESCGAVVVERTDIGRSSIRPYARISGWAIAMDGNRNPDPSFDGEVSVIKKTLAMAKLRESDIDYINPHGTGSKIGDSTELKALAHCGLRHAHLNATKSIVGHGLSAAGTVETIATLVQMERGKLHPTRNLNNPIDPSFNWVKDKAVEHDIGCALSLSYGFGGINTALCLQRY